MDRPLLAARLDKQLRRNDIEEILDERGYSLTFAELVDVIARDIDPDGTIEKLLAEGLASCAGMEPTWCGPPSEGVRVE